MKKKDIAAVGDTAHDLAQDIKADLANLGADALKVVDEYIAPRARDLADYLAPRAQDLGRRGVQFASEARDTVQPKVVQFASDARDALQPKVAQFASDARDTLQPKLAYLASEARDNLQPKVVQFASDARDTLQPKLSRFADDTRDNLQPYVDEAMERLQPHLDDAYARVQPLVDAGRDRFNADVLPRINEVVDSVAAMPQTQDAKDRLVAARAALAGELKLPEPEPTRSIGKTFLQLILATGLLAGIAYAIKRFLAPEDSGWQAHEPSEAYRRDAAFATEDALADVAPDATAELVTEEAPVVADEAVASAASTYGAGSYVGENPPEEFFIKGNERSMKYHLPGSGGHTRTIADVWFNSEAAAEAAGFTKAQR